MSLYASSQPHVLVAEDSEASGVVVERMLDMFGYEVTRVFDGAQAVQAAAATRFDLILMDGRMPVLDGYEAARRIREEEEGSRVPIVLVTACAQRADEDAAAAGMDGVLPKPMSMADLRATLERWCDAEVRTD